jgi:hypothetical protein
MTLLSETIRRLHLRLDSPYPSQVDTIVREAADTRAKILEWRREQRCKLVPRADNDDDYDGESA